MGKRFFVSCELGKVDAVRAEMTRKGCVMVSSPIEAYGRPDIVNFVAQYGSDYIAWVKEIDGVVDVHEDCKFDLS